jgi:hypothetical protein
MKEASGRGTKNNLANRFLRDKLALHRVYMPEHSKILFTNFALLRVTLRSVARSKDADDNIRRSELQQKIHSYCGEICLLDTGRRVPEPGNIRTLMTLGTCFQLRKIACAC